MNLDKLKTTDGLDLKGKRVLVRADLNVPAKNGIVTDATRLERVVPGLKDLASRGARVIVLSHFGRPKDGPDKENSLAPVAAELGKLAGVPVSLAPDCIGEGAGKAVSALTDGGIVVLENTQPSATSSSTTRSRPPIARTPPPKASRACCRRMPARS